MDHAHCHDESHDHDHDHDGPDRGAEYTLYTQIDMDGIRCLNETDPDAARKVFKEWERRFDVDTVTGAAPSSLPSCMAV